MTGGVLLRRPHVEHHDVAVTYSPQQFLPRYRLEAVCVGEVVAHEAIDFCQPGLRERLQGAIGAEDLGIG